uniref:Uncharacterized protein n=1 Tax=Paenibacillus athensensis TaxID=1967502 RepID=A0A4Y8Q2S8_9BACL
MSRSVKKSPVYTDHRTPGTRWSKRRASKAVRRFRGEVQDGKWYRKLYCSWNICDYRFFQTREQAVQEWETAPDSWFRKSPTRALMLQYWAKMYRRK